MRFMYAAAISIVLSATASASAQESPLDERARLHFASGASYFDAGNYERALEEFQTAYELSQRSELLYNIYLSHERLGNLDEAIANLEQYLANVDVEAERRAVLEQRLGNLRARATAATGTDSSARTDTSAGTDTSPDIAASTDTTPATDVAPPAPAPPPAEGSSSGLSTAALFSFIAAGTGLVLAGVFGTMALVEHNGLEDDCGPTCSDDQVSSLRTFNLIADISLGVAVLGGILGAVFQATSGGGDDEPSPTAWLGPDGAGLGVRGAL